VYISTGNRQTRSPVGEAYAAMRYSIAQLEKDLVRPAPVNSFQNVHELAMPFHHDHIVALLFCNWSHQCLRH